MIDQQARPTWQPSVPQTSATARPRRGTAWFAMMLTATFSAVQMWAMLVVLVMVDTSGVAKVALSCVMVGSGIAICLAVRMVRVISARERENERELRRGAPEYTEYVVR
ncbi:MAG TPA: hypothetical protein VGN81_25550 [Pseudonocardiaceae bacterium]|jgi:hypothetical protein